MARQKFAFDDEVEEVKPQQPQQPKKKAKLNKKKVALIGGGAIVLVIVAVLAFILLGGNDGPVYGERCAKLLPIDANKVSEVETQLGQNDKVNQVSIDVDCRIVKFTYDFKENTSKNDAYAIVKQSLHTFDDAMGYAKEDGKAWSVLLNQDDGRMQYDIEIVLKCNGNESFPIFGTKHAGVDEISYTSQDVKDQTSTNKALQRQAEIDAANAALAED